MGCTQNTDWSVSYLTSSNTEFSSARLFFPTKDWVNGIDVEFVQTSDGLHAYLQVHSHPIPPYLDNPKEALVNLQTENNSCCGAAIRREGGQKILLSPILQDFLLSSLKEGKSVTMELVGYETVILADGFNEHLYEMQNRPFDYPFHLPF